MGDALAVTLLEARGFTSEDFARSHPGGILGKRLLLRIDELMRTDKAIPKVKKDSMLSEALVEMSSKHIGMTTVVNTDGTLAGIFTDGDLRRTLDKNLDLHKTKISDVMHADCKTISLGVLAVEAIQMMEKYQIMALIVVDKKNKPVGAVHMHDLLKSGLV
jgi:arabinose-5-phosphate isomerase